MSQEEINYIHLNNLAQSGKLYLLDNSTSRYIGTNNGRLRLLDKSELVAFIPNNDLISTNVQDAIDEINSKIKSTTISILANEFIPAFSVATSTGYIANSNNIIHRNRIVGINLNDINIGFKGDVIGFGSVCNPNWNWIMGDKLFLNRNTISTTSPNTGFIQIIGTATSTNYIDVKLSQSTLL